MNFEYTEEQLLVQKTARQFAEEVLAPGVTERDEQARFPEEAVRQMGELGFMGMLVPERWGGAGLDTLSYVLAMEEIARVDASAAVIMSVNNSLVCALLQNWGDQRQKETFLKPLASGQWLGAYSLSEPQSGSDASNLRTTARREGDEYVLNGTKNWVTNGITSQAVIVFTRTSVGDGHTGISALIVEKGRPGFSTGKKEDKLGIRGSDTCELYFDNCRIPLANRVGEEGQGYKIALHTLDGGRIGIATQALGIARAALERSLDYAQERKQFGQPIARFGALQAKLAHMATNVEAARLLIHRAALLREANRPCTKAAAMAKAFASHAAMAAATDCVQIFGGYGYMRETGVERLMRDAKITQIYEGTSEIQNLVIARQLREESQTPN